MTPLIEASDKGYDKIVKLLLEQKGININAKDFSLFKASTKGYVEIVELLLKQEGIDINAKNIDSFCFGFHSALDMATKHGYNNIANILKRKAVENKSVNNSQIQ